MLASSIQIVNREIDMYTTVKTLGVSLQLWWLSGLRYLLGVVGDLEFRREEEDVLRLEVGMCQLVLVQDCREQHNMFHNPLTVNVDHV